MSIKNRASILLQKMSPYIRQKFSNTSTMFATFFDMQWRWLCTDLKEHTTGLDLGANIGDSCVFMAMYDRITHIDAYEPFPHSYEQAVSNIKRSGFDKKISIYNEAIGDRNTFMKIPERYVGGVYGLAKNFDKGRSILVQTLPEILKGRKNVIIKCDIEGAEHQIFDNVTKEHMKEVYRCQIEYHNGLQGLDKKLEKLGFKVRTEKQEDDLELGECGWIYATK